MIIKAFSLLTYIYIHTYIINKYSDGEGILSEVYQAMINDHRLSFKLNKKYK